MLHYADSDGKRICWNACQNASAKAGMLLPIAQPWRMLIGRIVIKASRVKSAALVWASPSRTVT